MSRVMQCVQYGSDNGRLVVYFHGAPGSVEECALFDESAKKRNLCFICFDRFAIDRALEGNDYYLAIADAIQARAGDKSFDIVGFSIGCSVAVKVGLLMTKRVRQMHLVSAAAPLEGGNFLDEMAGGMVFKMAMNYPLAFTALSYWQGVLCKISPSMLFSMIFASAKAEDKSLAQEHEFRVILHKVLMESYTQNIKGYMRDVREYVQPWQALLNRCETPITLWHGSEDNWSPIGMAEQLAKALPSAASVRIKQGASHYSCLMSSVESICQEL